MKLEVIKKQDALKMIKDEIGKFRAEMIDWTEWKLDNLEEKINAKNAKGVQK